MSTQSTANVRLVGIIPRTIAPPVPFQGWYCGTNKVRSAYGSLGDTPMYLETKQQDRNTDISCDSKLIAQSVTSYTEEDFDE